MDVEGGVVCCSVVLSTSGFEDGTTEKLTGISYGIWVNLIGIRVELGALGLDLLMKQRDWMDNCLLFKWIYCL